MRTRSPKQAPAQTLTIRIEAIVLEGIALTPTQARQFERALRVELQGLAALQERPFGAPATTAVEQAPQVTLRPPQHAALLGAEVGRSLWAVIGGAR
jgi:hypothetical protein